MKVATPIENSPLALVTGVGPGTGAAICHRFSEGGYRVAMLARDAGRLDALHQELPSSGRYVCDVSDPSQIDRVVKLVREEMGEPTVFVHNAVSADSAFDTFLDIEPAALNRNFQVNTMALLHFAQHLAPAMIREGQGSMIVTGNTSALRGKAGFAAFAPTKAAQRILAEAIARDLGPKGVHVAYVVIDAVIDVPWARQRWPDRPDESFIQPSAIAEEVWHLTRQDRSSWSFNVELRPFCEPW